jgi:excisionase family DNA binding protein
MRRRTSVLQASEYVSVAEAAHQLGVSARSVYGYIETKKLPAIRIGASIAIPAEALASFQRGVVGRARTRTPVWRVPTAENQQYVTTITVKVRQGQEARLEEKLAEMRKQREHLLYGTVARYIAQSVDCPEQIQIILVWRALVMPPEEEREAAFAALQVDLDDLLEWESAMAWHVMLYA